MRRRLAVIALCLLLALGGCVDAGVGLDDPDGSGDGSGKATSSPTPTADGALEVHYLDVGQADATLLVSPAGETMLVDSGDWRDDGETVLAYLEAQGDRKSVV